MKRVERCESQIIWDDYILDHGGHPLQLWSWGSVKAKHNWQTIRVFIYDDEQYLGAAQILERPLPGNIKTIAYIPRGPVCAEGSREVVLSELAVFAKKELRAIVLTIEPDWTEVEALSDWKKTDNTILLARTIILELTKTEDELLHNMAKKTRQYIRKSTAELIEIRQVKDEATLLQCLDIYKQTAKRANFALHSDEYYLDIFREMKDHSPVFAAFYQGKPVSFLWLAVSSRTAFELYGGMNEQGQELRANYTLKWHVIQTMKRWGIERYDFNGLLNDGVSMFKQSFADTETVLVGTYDKSLSPLYILWNKGLPIAKQAFRAIKKLRK